MVDVVIYTKDYCPYCPRAKDYLVKKGVSPTEIDVTHDEALLQEMVTRSGGRKTVPQIFVDGTSIGGWTDMMELEKAGKLNALLGKS